MSYVKIKILRVDKKKIHRLIIINLYRSASGKVSQVKKLGFLKENKTSECFIQMIFSALHKRKLTKKNN